MDIKDSEAILISDTVIDAARFNLNGTDGNLWKDSNLSAWLNSTGGVNGAGDTEGFYDKAFTDAEKEKINPSEVRGDFQTGQNGIRMETHIIIRIQSEISQVTIPPSKDASEPGDEGLRKIVQDAYNTVMEAKTKEYDNLHSDAKQIFDSCITKAETILDNPNATNDELWEALDLSQYRTVGQAELAEALSAAEIVLNSEAFEEAILKAMKIWFKQD